MLLAVSCDICHSQRKVCKKTLPGLTHRHDEYFVVLCSRIFFAFPSQLGIARWDEGVAVGRLSFERYLDVAVNKEKRDAGHR